MSLDRAILRLTEEIAEYQHGTPQAPKEKTVDWFLLRAKSLGLTCLRRMQQLQVEEDVAGAERFYRACAKSFKMLEVPPPIEVVRETIPE